MANAPASAPVPARLLSSVAVVGRDNEPIYLRGDLVAGSSGSTVAPPAEGGDKDKDAGGGAADESSKGAEGPGNSDGAVDDDDAFGFFGTESNDHQNDGSAIPAMSLTQQLVLHASLDRFEERASRSSQGGAVRWRAPGATAANGMWMGLLCEVEERWDVYGYLTNTGIKFMILVEKVHLNADGSRRSSPTLPPMSAGGSSSREADLKNIFAWIHELYVRHTMNPFSRLRSPIQSGTFDKGIMQMAESFNSSVLEQLKDGESGGGSVEGLVWM